MAQSETRRQKKLAKKKARREDKRAHSHRLQSDDASIRLAGAEKWPIVAALVPDSLWQHGMCQVILSRRHPNGGLACAAFLLDVYCLGVKDALWRIMSDWEYDELVRKSQKANGSYRQVAPEYFAKLVHDAVAFAQRHGLAPHADYHAARMLLAGIDPSQCTEQFEFGRNGKPFYIQGPFDSQARVQAIMQKMASADGNYLIGGKESDVRHLLTDDDEGLTDDDEFES